MTRAMTHRDTPNDLLSLVEAASLRPVPPEVAAIADVAHSMVGDPVLAVLAYGSCLRGVSTDDSLVDIYLLVDSYDRMGGSWILRFLNRLVPPNVYYAECRFGTRMVRSKYAVVSLDQFERLVLPTTHNPYFWARFAQPTSIVFATDSDARERVVRALCHAAMTMIGEARDLAGVDADAVTLWTSALAATYRTELRSEGPTRGREIFDADRDYYTAVAAAVPPGIAGRGSFWALRRTQGKALSVARLLKAAFTFSGGADYLAWKIERHSGVKVTLTPWQRRHPILAGVMLFPKLYASGAFR